jgi:hypothetical protein
MMTLMVPFINGADNKSQVGTSARIIVPTYEPTCVGRDNEEPASCYIVSIVVAGTAEIQSALMNWLPMPLGTVDRHKPATATATVGRGTMV